MFCPKCGKQLPEGAKFCSGCGNQVQTIRAGAANLPSNTAMTRDIQNEMRGSRRLTIILCIVLFVLVLVAAGMGIYYFKVLKDGDDTSVKVLVEEPDASQDEEERAEKTQEQETEKTETEPEAEVQDEEEAEGVVSDTNEVVADTILENVPKAVYSYTFNEELGNAEVVVRNDPDTEPEVDDDIQPRYVRGMDGKAVYLDGSYGIKLSDVERVGDSYTIAFWMKADRLCDWSPFIHIGHDQFDSGKRVRLWLGQKTDGASIAPIISSERASSSDSFEIRPKQSMPNTIEPDIWYHIAFTVDGSRQGSKSGRVPGTLYVAGQYIGEGDIVLDTMDVDDFDVYLGINCWDELYPVAFDDVKIWDQVLDAGQIQELYQAYE